MWRATLTKLLECPNILQEIEHCHDSGDKILWDMCDGSVFKSHPIFQQDRKALQVIAYFDELELCNPLGSNVKKQHKTGKIMTFPRGFISGNTSGFVIFTIPVTFPGRFPDRKRHVFLLVS